MNWKILTKKLAISMTIIVAVFAFASCAKKQSVQQNSSQDNNQDQSQNNQQQNTNPGNNTHNSNNNQNNNQQTTDPYEKWEIFESEGWKYRIKYPSELFINDEIQGDRFPGDSCLMCGYGGRSLIISDQEDMGIHDVMPDENIHIIISTSKKKEGETLNEHIKRGTDEGGDWKYSDISVDGRSAVMITNKENRLSSMTIDNGDYFYSLYAESYGENDSAENYEVIEKIFNTFSFVE